MIEAFHSYGLKTVFTAPELAEADHRRRLCV